VGTPRDLYEAPADIEVAEFMGFRNRLSGSCISRDGATARVRTSDGVLSGNARGQFAPGTPVLIACRPDDLAIGPAGCEGLASIVETIEYRGREFVGSARTASGAQLTFRSAAAADIGTPVDLLPDPARTLVFPAA